ncbi:MAG: LLM class flavin-dependent oxidoreductase [Chloroflexi bacterium]|nr:LLM class flavin-dependent oxidoreductase [Chloroflexota bacterium]
MAHTERIGLTLPGGEGIGQQEQLELVRLAERLGYDSVWVGESWGPEVFTTLAWLACNTSRIRLAAGIANVFSRTPGLMAQTVATLDQISGGRVILGLGTSGRALVENWHGVPFQQGTQRLKEYAEIMRLALGGQRVDHQGEVFQLRGFRLNMEPLRPRAPIFFASITPAGLRATAEAADGWLPIWTGPEEITRGMRQIQAAATAAGRTLEGFEVAAEVHGAVSTDPAVRQRAKAQLAHYIGNMGVYYHQHVTRQGFGKEADAIQAAFARREREQAAALVTDEMVDRLLLIGDAAACRARLAQYRQAGVALPLLNLLGGLSKAQVMESLEALAPGRG